MPEARFAGGEIKLPHPGEALVIHRDGLVAPGRQLHWSEAPDSAGPFIAYAGVWAAARRRGDLAGEDGVSPTRLTEAGEAFKGPAADLINRLHAARALVRGHQTAAGDALVFAVPHTLAFAFFPAWLGR